MTLLDDNQLSLALHRAADEFDLPTGAADRILEAAEAAPTGTVPLAAVRTLLPHRPRTRMVLGAAAAVLVAMAISLAFIPVGTSSPGIRALPPGNSGISVPSTTIPTLSAHSVLGESQGVQFGTSVGALSPSAARAAASGSGAPSSSVQATKVISVGTVSLAISSTDMQRALAQLTAIARIDGGYVASSTLQVGAGSQSTTSSGTIVLRVPEKHFTALVVQVQHVGHVTSAKTASTDVTGQYVDLQARIAALKVSRAQYLAIMAKAGSISEILAVQSQVDNIQSQIEQLEGQRNLLANQAAYGTLSVSLAPPGQGPNSPVHSTGIAKSVRDSIHGFILGVEWLIRIAGPTLFVLLCLLALFLLGRVCWRAARRRMI